LKKRRTAGAKRIRKAPIARAKGAFSHVFFPRKP